MKGNTMASLKDQGKPTVSVSEDLTTTREAIGDNNRIMSKKSLLKIERLVSSEINNERYHIRVRLNLNVRLPIGRKNSSGETISTGGRTELKCMLWRDHLLPSIALST